MIETNPISKDYHSIERTKTVYWTAKNLKITRLRMLSDDGFPFWDVSYCHGTINGEPVIVQLPFDQLPKRGRNRAIVEYAKKDNVYAKGLGILNDFVVSVLC